MKNNNVPQRSRRIVVKLGSSALTHHPNLIDDICRQIVELSENRARDFLIVSSGAIAMGWKLLGYPARPTQMSGLQAAASTGQCELMRRYADAMRPHGRAVAQVLLTHSDLASRRRLTNAGNALEALFAAGAIPIVNENDAVSTDEIAFGDNDQLAAMVTPLVQADVLFLLSNIPGVLDEAGNPIEVMTASSQLGDHRVGPAMGKGGIQSKVDAARKAARSGTQVIIGPAAESDILRRVLVDGENIGTRFEPAEDALRARHHWIAYTLKPRGVILVNEGAARALTDQGASLLPVGVLGIAGQFSRGDAVRIVGPSGEVARGLARMGGLEVARAAGKTTQELSARVGEWDTVVIHRNDLVLSS